MTNYETSENFVRELKMRLKILTVFSLAFLGQAQRHCSFDNGVCGFIDDRSGTDDFDWTRLRGAAEFVIRYRMTTTYIYVRRFWPGDSACLSSNELQIRKHFFLLFSIFQFQVFGSISNSFYSKKKRK